MRILFVEKKLRIDKLGPCCVAAALRNAGHDVDLVQDDIDSADEHLRIHPADFVMYSVTSDMASWVERRNRELKAKYGFISVVGGPHPTYAHTWGTDDAAIDFIVRGPGEDAVLDIVNGLSDRIAQGSLLRRDGYLPPYRSIIYKYDEFGRAPMKRFIACRTCLFSCAHCFNSAFKKMYPGQKSALRFRPSPETMFGEIMDVRGTFGLELAIFNDDDLAGDQNWIEEFCNLLTAAHVPVRFCGAIRANTIGKDGIEMMAKAGCSTIFIGLESANRDTQKLLRRGGVTNEDVYRAVRSCEEAGIRTRIHVMIGLPVDNPLSDAFETFEFVKACGPTNCSATIYQPLPGTELWSYCIENGFIDADTEPSGYFDRTVLRIPRADEINRLGKLFHFAVNGRWTREELQRRVQEPMSHEQVQELILLAQQESARDLYGAK